ncbi:hypothetical protein [Aeromicrobium massiliense]|uniref:hypothetical protein n=1 Tax=Aeromicrobium massiliense TaxID=1464554 RepID=UPI00057894F1|nr:hypothetical protein [Aeromicrobium massiliense]
MLRLEDITCQIHAAPGQGPGAFSPQRLLGCTADQESQWSFLGDWSFWAATILSTVLSIAVAWYVRRLEKAETAERDEIERRETQRRDQINLVTDLATLAQHLRTLDANVDSGMAFSDMDERQRIEHTRKELENYTPVLETSRRRLSNMASRLEMARSSRASEVRRIESNLALSLARRAELAERALADETFLKKLAETGDLEGTLSFLGLTIDARELDEIALEVETEAATS